MCRELDGHCYVVDTVRCLKAPIFPSSFLTLAKSEGNLGASGQFLTPVRESQEEMVLLTPSFLWTSACLGTMSTTAMAVSEGAKESSSPEGGSALAFLPCGIPYFYMAYFDLGFCD